MCERSSLGFPHTQNRMSCRPRVAEILLMRSPKTAAQVAQPRHGWAPDPPRSIDIMHGFAPADVAMGAARRRSEGGHDGGWRLGLVTVANCEAGDRSIGSASARAAAEGSLAGLPL